jgi:hypothetical protein
MTTIISRLYADPESGAQALAALRAAGHDPATLSLLTPAADQDATAMIAAAGLGSLSAARYAAALAARAGRGAVLVVRAPFTPFGRARNAIAIADAHEPLPVTGVEANQHVPTRPNPRIFHPAIARHAHVMTRDMPPFIDRRRGTVSSAFGVPLLWNRTTPRRVTRGGPVSRLFWPMPLVWRRRPAGSVSAARHLSRLFWPMPLLARR